MGLRLDRSYGINLRVSTELLPVSPSPWLKNYNIYFPGLERDDLDWRARLQGRAV